jgi:hypothetical protein
VKYDLAQGLGWRKGRSWSFCTSADSARRAPFRSQLRGAVTDKHDGYLLRPRTDACRCDKVVRSLSSRSSAPRPTQIIREGETVHKVRIGLCLGRAGSRNAKMDRWEVVECKQSLGKLFNVPRDGGQERRRPVCPTTRTTNWRQDTRQWKRK